MITQYVILPQQYRDSVSLMRLSSGFVGKAGVKQFSAVMATEANLDLLRSAGLLEGGVEAGANDLILAASGSDAESVTAALAAAKTAVMESAVASSGGGCRRETPIKSIGMALEGGAKFDLALISTPGEWAAHEAMKALIRGMHVMMFSDNVSIEDEAALKRYAASRELLMMGPDCGTAIIAGAPLAFANVVRRGCIGVVGASGTGMQQITCLVDQYGAGISHAIGTGGHDLAKQIGGATTLMGIRMLERDPGTSVIILVSKPPAPEVAQKVLEAASATGKEIVVNFIGLRDALPNLPRLHKADTLEDAAMLAVKLAGGRPPAVPAESAPDAPKYAPSQRFLRGLYSGGTFCYEASMLLRDLPGGILSNAPIAPEQKLDDPWSGKGNCLVDMGDDVFTRGRPHPMMDPSLRLARILEEANDPETAVILLDVVLGHGSHADPAGSLAGAIGEARRIAAAAGRELAFVGFVCGTAGDPQNRDAQEKILRDAGVLLAGSNARAVRLARALLPAVKVH